jgi:hypothetical protein
VAYLKPKSRVNFRLTKVDWQIKTQILKSTTVDFGSGSVNLEGQVVSFGLLDPEDEGTVILQTSGNIHPTTQCHFPEDLNLQG